jgi:hypothetical protein
VDMWTGFGLFFDTFDNDVSTDAFGSKRMSESRLC